MFTMHYQLFVNKNIGIIVNLIIYSVFPPIQVSEACQIFRDLYDDYNLEEFFQTRENDVAINTKLCNEKTEVIKLIKRYV